MGGAISQHKQLAMGKKFKDGGAVEEEKRNIRPPKEAMGTGLLRQATEFITGRSQKERTDKAIEEQSGESRREKQMREETDFKKGGSVKRKGK